MSFIDEGNQNNKNESSKLAVIKRNLMADRTLALFRDNLPNVSGKHAIEAAKRFAKMIYTTVSQSPTLQACSIESLIKAASISASLDLDIDVRGLAYLVPYKNKGRLEAQFQIGYLGLIELAYRSGKVKAISAHCIYESERDKVKITRIDGQFKVEHPFSYEEPNGDIIAVYATAAVDGIEPQTAVLRKCEIERFRKCSKAPDSPAWTGFYPEMAQKTAIRVLSKYLPKSILGDLQKGIAYDTEESFVNANDKAKDIISGEMGSQAIDAKFEQPSPQGQPTQPGNGGQTESEPEEPAFMQGA